MDGLEEYPFQWKKTENEGKTQLESGDYSTSPPGLEIIHNPPYRSKGIYIYESHFKNYPESKFERDISNPYQKAARVAANIRNKNELVRRLLKHYEVGFNEPYELTISEMGRVKALGANLSRGYISKNRELHRAYSEKFSETIADDRERFLIKFKKIRTWKKYSI